MPGSAPKTIRTLAGSPVDPARESYGDPQQPLKLNDVAAALLQLQNTVNELISKFNAHNHTENTGAAYTQNATTAVPVAAQQVTGAGAAATSLFTAS